MRISALRPSTVFWARSMALVTILASMGTSSGRVSAHHPLHGAGGEQAHELVLEREEEPALARVALAAGPAPELVVDAARLVALAAEHVETAEGADLVALVAALLLEAAEQLLVLGLALVGVEVEALADRLALGQALGIATEEDVDAAAGHVGGHRHGVEPAGLGRRSRPPGRAAWR